MSSKIKLLISGSAGFIMSNLVRYILKNSKDYDIVSIDDIKPPVKLNTIYANRAHQFYMGDIINSHLINNIFEIERPDIIIHGAAESFVDKSLTAGQEFVKSNVLGTQVLIDAAVKYNSRFIYISTDEVYGALNTESEPSWTENFPLAPRNPYSATKASGELLVKAAHNTHGLQYNITRCCNNYGPRQQRRNLIPKIIANILEKIEVPLYGSGSQIREWIHCADNCSAIKTIIEKGTLNETYNIGSGQEFSNIEVFNEISNIMGGGYDLLRFVKDPRPGHDFRYSVNCDKIKKLGWKPEFKFKGVDGGLNHTINFYKNNQWVLK
jgi:dTDP-glucose 4,6-dehydratase